MFCSEKYMVHASCFEILVRLISYKATVYGWDGPMSVKMVNVLQLILVKVKTV